VPLVSTWIEDAEQAVVIAGLVRAGFDTLTTTQATRLGTLDAEQLRYATEQGRVFYSLNARDLVRIHGEWLSAGTNHAGIIVIPYQRRLVREKLRRLSSLLTTISAEDFSNRLEFL
jgi:hypothetical protein